MSEILEAVLMTVNDGFTDVPICNTIRRLEFDYNRIHVNTIKGRIFYLLQESDGPITFYELREKLRHEIKSKTHPNRPIIEGIDSLIKEGIPIRTLNRDTDVSYFIDKKEYKKLKGLCEGIQDRKDVLVADAIYRIFE